jgi:hypothetical protein
LLDSAAAINDQQSSAQAYPALRNEMALEFIPTLTEAVLDRTKKSAKKHVLSQP